MNKTAATLLAWSIAFLIVSLTAWYPLFIVVCLLSFVSLMITILRLHAGSQAFPFLTVSAVASVSWTLFGQLTSFINVYSLSSVKLLSGSSFHDWPYDTGPSLAAAISLNFLYAGVFALCAASAVVRAQENKVLDYVYTLLSDKPLQCIKSSTFIGFYSSLFFFYLVSVGNLGIQGAMNDLASDTGLSWWKPFLDLAITTIPISSALILINHTSSRNSRFIAIVSILIGSYISFTIGRRSLVYFIVSLAYSYYLFLPKILGYSLRLKVRDFVILGVLCFSVSFATTFFQYVRTLGLESADPLLLFQNLQIFLTDIDVQSGIHETQTQNLISRSLLHSTLAELLELENFNLSLFSDLHQSFLLSLPSFVFPFKSQLIPSKQFLAQSLGYDVDFISSPQTLAYNSFGIAGFLIYPFMQVAAYLSLFLVFNKLIKRIKYFPIVVALVFWGWLVNLVIIGFAEVTTTAIIRPLVTISALIAMSVAISFFSLRSRKHDVVPWSHDPT